MTIQKTSKKWRCAECGEVYLSPIPVFDAQHKCQKPMPPKFKRKGMLPE